MVASPTCCVETERVVNESSAGGRYSDQSSIASSLLVQAQAKDGRAWQRIVYLYGPLVRGWCRRSGLRETDAEDVAQEVFRAAFAGIERFRREEAGQSFRGWLYGITRNKVLDQRRREARSPNAVGGTEFGQRVGQHADPLSVQGIEEASRADVPSLYRRALELIQTDFAERTWKAFWATTIDGQPAAEVAAELEMSVGAVYVAKSRVLARLREEFVGLEEFDE